MTEADRSLSPLMFLFLHQQSRVAQMLFCPKSFYMDYHTAYILSPRVYNKGYQEPPMCLKICILQWKAHSRPTRKDRWMFPVHISPQSTPTSPCFLCALNRPQATARRSSNSNTNWNWFHFRYHISFIITWSITEFLRSCKYLEPDPSLVRRRYSKIFLW